MRIQTSVELYQFKAESSLSLQLSLIFSHSSAGELAAGHKSSKNTLKN